MTKQRKRQQRKQKSPSIKPVVWYASAQWQDAITFVGLILFLLFRPEGILGTKRRSEEVVA